MKRQRQEKKRGFLSISYLLIVLMIAALTACGGGGGSSDGGGGSNNSSSSSNDNPNPTPTPATGTISGSVSGTIIVAVNDNGDIVASDDTTGKTPDANDNYPFTLTGIPTGVNIRVYLITSTGVYPMYFDSNDADTTPDTNVFSLSSAAAINLGYVDTSTGQAIPATNPINTSGVSAGAENTNSPIYTSSGTYTYDSTNGALIGNTTSTDSVCGTIGTDNYTVTTLTATTMIMVDSDGFTLTWTRPSGNANDIVGIWTMSYFTNLWVLTFNSNTFTMVENYKCVRAQSFHIIYPGNESYNAFFYVDDPTQQYTSVTVAGPYITQGPLNLTYDSTEGVWEGSIFFGSTPPTNLPLTYTFTLNSTGGTTYLTDDIEAFVVPLPTNLSPSGTGVSVTPTFSWTGAGSGYTYWVGVFDSNYNSVWHSGFLTTTSVAYGGPALTSGATYNYEVSAFDAYGNQSMNDTESFVVQ